MTLDELFYKEFNVMMQDLKGMVGSCNLQDIPLPEQVKSFIIEKRKKVVIKGIEEEHYNNLNETEAYLWGTSSLKRRKFDYKGEYMKDKDGNYIMEDVVCPRDCTAIISDTVIGVPYKFKPKEQFLYVDILDAPTRQMYIYIVPKKYLYMVKQTALVLSWNKLRRFYSGIGVALQNGYTLYMYIVPYNPMSSATNYKVLATKTSVDYNKELNIIKNFWIQNNIMFNPDWCVLDEHIRGRVNMAYEPLNGTEDIFERFDLSKPLSEEEEEIIVEETAKTKEKQRWTI